MLSLTVRIFPFPLKIGLNAEPSSILPARPKRPALHEHTEEILVQKSRAQSAYEAHEKTHHCNADLEQRIPVRRGHRGSESLSMCQIVIMPFILLLRFDTRDDYQSAHFASLKSYNSPGDTLRVLLDLSFVLAMRGML